MVLRLLQKEGNKPTNKVGSSDLTLILLKQGLGFEFCECRKSVMGDLCPLLIKNSLTPVKLRF